MKKRKLFKKLLGVVFAVFVFGLIFNQTATAEEKHIVDIEIKGNNAVSTATILNKLKLKPGDVFVESALNKELKRLYAMGFFNDVFVEIEDLQGGVLVIFTVVEKPIIHEISFTGNSRLKDGKLAKKLIAKKGDLLDLNTISRDVGAIRGYYIEEGYSSVTIDYDISTDPETGLADVTFLIDEGMPVKVKKITFEGNENIASGELVKLMRTKTAWWFIRKGSFNEEEFQTDLNRITSYYRSKGFLDAKVGSKRDFSEDGQEMYLTVVVDEGERYLVGEITISGDLIFTEEEVFLRLKMKAGELKR